MSQDTSTLERDMMTLSELRERMGVSATSAYALARKDALPVPVIRVGRQFRFSRHAWEQLLNSQHAKHEDEEAQRIVTPLTGKPVSSPERRGHV
jgi:predicted DNA-binding transcriptional regulator AlpA